MDYYSKYFQRNKNDKEIVLACIINGSDIKDASIGLQRDRDVILAAVTKNIENINCIPQEFIEDQEFIYSVVSTVYKNTPEFINHCEQKNMKQLFQAAVKQGFSLKYLPEVYRGDKDIVLTAAINNSDNLQYVSGGLKLDREFIMSVLQVISETVIPYCFSCDKEFVLDAIHKDASLFKQASLELKDDTKLVAEAIMINEKCLKYASRRVQTELWFNANPDPLASLTVIS
jgi:hypothetical protein